MKLGLLDSVTTLRTHPKSVEIGELLPFTGCGSDGLPFLRCELPLKHSEELLRSTIPCRGKGK